MALFHLLYSLISPGYRIFIASEQKMQQQITGWEALKSLCPPKKLSFSLILQSIVFLCTTKIKNAKRKCAGTI